MGLVSSAVEIASKGNGMSSITKTNQRLLEAISDETDNTLVSILALALIADPPECDERLSILIHQTVASGSPLSTVMNVLLEIDEKLKEKDGDIPCAMRFAPLVVELLSHAHATQLQDTAQKIAAESAPIFNIGRRTLVAVAGHLNSPNAFSKFCDRLLGLVMKNRVKKVWVQMPSREDALLAKASRLLQKDLESQRIRVELVGLPLITKNKLF